MARETFALTGFSDLEEKLKALPQNVAKRASFAAMRRAAKIMADEQRALAGPFADTIIVKARAKNTAGLAEYGEVMRGGGSFRDASAALRDARRSSSGAPSRITVVVGSSAPHAHFSEFGTVERFWKSGKSTGIMPMNPFIRPAWDAKVDDCLVAIKRELLVEIEKAETKIARG